MQDRLELHNRLYQAVSAWKSPLSPAERAVDDWAMVDDHQAVLEVLSDQGRLLRHYGQQYRLRACGLCFGSAPVATLRDQMDGAEIMPSSGGDIPWQDQSFDRLLIPGTLPSYVGLKSFLGESLRVLKPGGRLTLALPTLPLAAQGESLRRSQMLKLLEDAGFVDVSCRRSRLSYYSIIAHKAHA